MKKEISVYRKADKLISECKDIDFQAFETKRQFTVDAIAKSNIRACGMALMVVNEILNSSYWWQVKRKLFFQAVKIAIYVRLAESKDALNEINEINKNTNK
jgi:hypothetical protein